jgi:MFS family permease
MQVARIISSLLAAGILQMRGVHGHTGWFWLFLIEGLLTFVIGLIVCTVLSSIGRQRLTKPLELLLPPPVPYAHQERPLPSFMVYRARGSHHDQRMS